MEAIKVHTGKSVPLMNDNIDTDQIIPKKFLKSVKKSGYEAALFEEWRYLEDGSDNPDFILNSPEYQGATILVTGDNFGCGSSREHAAWALKDFGFKIVIAESYSDIFYMNALKNGLLPIRLGKAERELLASLPSDNEVKVDLPNQTIYSQNGEFTFEIDQTWKDKLVNGLDDIDITLGYEKYIEEYESKIPSYWQ